jgi:hypothetical protein
MVSPNVGWSTALINKPEVNPPSIKLWMFMFGFPSYRLCARISAPQRINDILETATPCGIPPEHLHAFMPRLLHNVQLVLAALGGQGSEDTFFQSISRPKPSFTAAAKFCSVPKYLSVVCTDACPSSN